MQSGQALMEPEPEPGVEELWEQEMERLWSSQAQVRELPYAMVDKRFIRWVPPPPTPPWAGPAGGQMVGVGGAPPRGCTGGMGWKSPAVGRRLWPRALLCLARWAQRVTQGCPTTTPSQAAAGAQGGEDLLLAAMSAQVADCPAAPRGGSAAAGPGLWALGRGSLRDRG